MSEKFSTRSVPSHALVAGGDSWRGQPRDHEGQWTEQPIGDSLGVDREIVRSRKPTARWPFAYEPRHDVQENYGDLAQDSDANYERSGLYHLIRMPIAALVPTQDPDDDEWGDAEDYGVTGKPFAVDVGGNIFLIDGHHRAVKAGPHGSMDVWVRPVDTATTASTTFEQERNVNIPGGPGHNLRDHWVRGPGAAKIGWGTDGSFARCVALLGEHVTRPHGLCAEYHKQATGEWPAEKGVPSQVRTVTSRLGSNDTSPSAVRSDTVNTPSVQAGRCPPGHHLMLDGTCMPNSEMTYDVHALALREGGGDPKKPYGDVPYADPGYQPDGVKRYPLDTEAHIRAAWSYINVAHNADRYSASDLRKVRTRITRALRGVGVDVDAAARLLTVTSNDLTVFHGTHDQSSHGRRGGRTRGGRKTPGGRDGGEANVGAREQGATPDGAPLEEWQQFIDALDEVTEGNVFAWGRSSEGDYEVRLRKSDRDVIPEIRGGPGDTWEVVEEDEELGSAVDLRDIDTDVEYVRVGGRSGEKPRDTTDYDVGDVTSAGDATTAGGSGAPGVDVVGDSAFWQGVLTVEGVESGDGREFAPGSLMWDNPPLPLMWQKETSHGGRSDVSVRVGSILNVWRSGEFIMGSGVIDLGHPDGIEAHRRLQEGFLSGNSVDVDSVDGASVELIYPELVPGEEPLTELGALVNAQPELTRYHRGRIRGTTLVEYPAFTEARLALASAPVRSELGELTVGEPDCGCTTQPNINAVEPVNLTAGGPPNVHAAAHTITIPDLPPAHWFNEPTDVAVNGALTVTDEGRVYGVLAPLGVRHRSFPDREVFTPFRKVDYGRFMSGETIVAGGSRVATGPITMNCGHLPAGPGRRFTADDATEHYDNSCSIVATVRVGENDRGVWVAGALLPGVDSDQVARMLACKLSGDWRTNLDRPGWRELTAALLVPTPGFGLARTRSSVQVEGDALVASSVPVVFRQITDVERRRRRVLARVKLLQLRTRAREFHKNSN